MVRRLQRNTCWSLPATTQRKFTNAFRTAYASLVCIVLLYLDWEGFGQSGFIVVVCAAIAAAALYVGQWQSDIWKVTYSCPLCSIIGVLLGSISSNSLSLQLVFLFVGMTVVNQVSCWDRLPKVVGGLGFVLGMLWFVVHDTGGYGVVTAFKELLMVIVVPWLVVGFTLLFPITSLAVHAAQVKVETTCAKLNAAVTALKGAFVATDYAGLYCTHVQHLLTNCETTLTELKTLQGYVDYEAILFPSLVHFPPALQVFVDVCGRVVREMSVLVTILDQILNNNTHKTFVENLRPALDDMTEAVRDILRTVRDHLCGFEASLWDPSGQVCGRSGARMDGRGGRGGTRVTRRWTGPASGGSHAPPGSDYPHADESVRDPEAANGDAVSVGTVGGGGMVDGGGVADMDMEMIAMISNFEFDWEGDEAGTGGEGVGGGGAGSSGGEAGAQRAVATALLRLQAARLALLEGYRRTRIHFVWRNKSVSNLSSLAANPLHPHAQSERVGHGQGAWQAEHEQRALAVQEETSHLRWRNLQPRAAYLHRLLLLLDSFKGLGGVTEARQIAPFAVSACVCRALKTFVDYFHTALIDTVQLVVALCFTPATREDPVAAGQVSSRTDASDLTNTSARSDSSGRTVPPAPVTKTSVCTRLSTLWTTLSPLLVRYIQPMKIALALTLASLFVLVKEVRYGQVQNGVWAMLCIAFIRQDNTSSSFLTGFQRLEGTVLGSVYAFFMFSITQSSFMDGRCPMHIALPVLVGWTFLCAFFREGERHGYAALVAGFTPVVLFLGGSS